MFSSISDFDVWLKLLTSSKMELFGLAFIIDLSNYATKTDLKNVSHVDVSNFALKSTLASLKTKVNKLDIDKLTPFLMI